MNNFHENQLVYADIGEDKPIFCRISKISTNEITVSDGNHLYDVAPDDIIVTPKFLHSSNNIKTSSKKETVNHPEHYLPGDYEAIKVIEAWLDKNGCYNFCIGNALKYIARLGRKEDSNLSEKDKTLEDLNKAIWYLNYAKYLINTEGENE